MPKIIELTDQIIARIRQAFEETMKNPTLTDGKFIFTQTAEVKDRKATVFFSEKAWIKMQALIREFSDEIAWHGVSFRNGEKDEYIITDILVYPQNVTGATVTTNQADYEKWLMELDDNTFNNLRMQGHSHVNMCVSPSAVDKALYDGIVERLESDMFYIFMIWNKKNERMVRIYDRAKNLFFDTKDIEIKILDGDVGLENFISNTKQIVKKAATVSYTYKNPYANTYFGYDDDDVIYGYGAMTSYSESKPQASEKTERKEYAKKYSNDLNGKDSNPQKAAVKKGRKVFK